MEKKPLRKSRAAIFGIPVAFLAIWAALYAVASVLPAIPLVGGGTFGGQEFILTLAGILFGPWAGLVAASIGGFLASFIGPATAYFGLATFYTHAVGAFAAGLLMLNKGWSRIVAAILLIVGIIAWPLIPWFSSIGAYVYSKFAYWPLYLTGFVGILLSPWAVKQIRTFQAKRVWMGVAIISWTAYMVNHVWLSLGYSVLYPEGPEQWVFTFWSGIMPLQRVLLTVVSVLVGTALVVGLYRAGIRFPSYSGSALSEESAEDACD